MQVWNGIVAFFPYSESNIVPYLPNGRNSLGNLAEGFQVLIGSALLFYDKCGFIYMWNISLGSTKNCLVIL